MIDMITKDAFKELLQYQNSTAPCISIYIPTHRSGVQVNEKQDVIVFKNALQTTQSNLQQQGLNAQEIDSLLEPGLNLIGDDVFWNNQLDGLAVFITEGFNKVMKLPFSVAEKCYINSSFYVTPILPAMLKTKEFLFTIIKQA